MDYLYFDTHCIFIHISANMSPFGLKFVCFTLFLYSPYKNKLIRSLQEPGGPCTKSMEISESRMERVN